MDVLIAFILGALAGLGFGVWANERMHGTAYRSAIQSYEEQIAMLSAITDDTEQVYAAKARLN